MEKKTLKAAHGAAAKTEAAAAAKASAETPASEPAGVKKPAYRPFVFSLLAAAAVLIVISLAGGIESSAITHTGIAACLFAVYGLLLTPLIKKEKGAAPMYLAATLLLVLGGMRFFTADFIAPSGLYLLIEPAGVLALALLGRKKLADKSGKAKYVGGIAPYLVGAVLLFAGYIVYMALLVWGGFEVKYFFYNLAYLVCGALYIFAVWLLTDLYFAETKKTIKLAGFARVWCWLGAVCDVLLAVTALSQPIDYGVALAFLVGAAGFVLLAAKGNRLGFYLILCQTAACLLTRLPDYAFFLPSGLLGNALFLLPIVTWLLIRKPWNGIETAFAAVPELAEDKTPAAPKENETAKTETPTALCPSCKAENALGDLFCSKCGTKLSKESASEQPEANPKAKKKASDKKPEAAPKVTEEKSKTAAKKKTVAAADSNQATILDKYRAGLSYLDGCETFDEAAFREFNSITGNQFTEAELQNQLGSAKLMIRGMDELKNILRSTMVEGISAFEELERNGIDLSKYNL